MQKDALMDRYSWEHGKGSIDWENRELKYHCYFDRNDGKFVVDGNSFLKGVGVVYFKDWETANNCIEEVIKPFLVKHPEFKL